MGSLTPSCQGSDLPSFPGPFSFLPDWLTFFQLLLLPNKIQQSTLADLHQNGSADGSNTFSQHSDYVCASVAGRAWSSGAQPAPNPACLLSMCWLAVSQWTGVLGAVKAAWESGGGGKLSKWTIKDSSFSMGWRCIDRVVARKHMLGVTVLFCA